MKKDGKRTLIVGASGSGKSYFAKKLWQKETRLLVIDNKSEYDNLTAEFAYLDLARKLCKDKFKLRYIPVSPVADFERLSAWILKIQKASDKNITIVIDEAYFNIPSGTFARNPKSNAIKLFTLGRSLGINLIVITQRLNSIDNNVRQNCNDIYFFKSRNKEDIDSIKKITGYAWYSSLKPYQWICQNEIGGITTNF